MMKLKYQTGSYNRIQKRSGFFPFQIIFAIIIIIIIVLL